MRAELAFSPDSPRRAAIIPRTIALFILLYQIRFFAADIADTSFFSAALFGAFGAALFLNRKKINGSFVSPVQALVIIALIPWAVRLFVSVPRWLVPGASRGAVIFDSLLLNMDRNNFAALIPFYWTAASSYFSLKSRVFLRADIIAADVLFLVIFSIAPAASLDVYRWPILMIGIFALVLFLQILSLVLSIPPELKLRRREGILASSFLFLLIFLGGAFFIRPFQEKAVEKGGGLLEPNLFSLDFSQYIRLESEISVGDDLVLIVKKDPEDSHILLRRYTLSGYDLKQGFFRLEDIDEAAHPRNLPGKPVRLPVKEIEDYRVSEQEYYLVNFDASAFIGMNMPVEIIPFETWDASSFNSAYSVTSYTSEIFPEYFPPELRYAVRGRPGAETLELSAEEYALYTDYGGDETIASFAREIIDEAVPSSRRGQGDTSYWEKIQILFDRLKYGEYRYSLKPGIAPDGDQLKYFLFTSKKAYCSYYAFAFTLMLRSLGIPSRVAAGFFVDPSTETFNYYPVRANMAHAWTEVWFPGYGWIEYDPTSTEIAEGEEYSFSQGTPPELFERLMKEILDNRSRLKVKETEETGDEKKSLAALGRKTLRFLRRASPFLAAGTLIFLFMAMRAGFFWLSALHKNPRKKVLCLWAHAGRRLALAGFGRNSAVPFALGEAEWAKNLDPCFTGLYSLYQDSAAARFAPVFPPEQSREAEEHYRLFGGSCQTVLPPGRRLLAWLLPPLALLLPAPRNINKNGGDTSARKTAGTLLLVILLFSLRGETGRAQEESIPADTLFSEALNAQMAENWERAIELFEAGAEEYPLDARFPLSLGDIYYYRNFYRLAWDEYRRAEEIIPWDTDLLSRLANTSGYLNRNEVSADYLERLLALEPDDMSAISSLAWMYFKLHRLPEGERLLLDTIERMGEDADLSMTLGTVYSDMFRYREAKDYYLKAIEGAESTGDKLFAALAHYNLSILESRFYEFALAYERTNASLAALDRSSGRLARGEMFQRRMELPRAMREYQEAYGREDSSPLSKLNLADLFQTGGRLEEARLYAEDCLKAGDESWMLNYGIDPIRYKRDIHDILKSAYEGLMKAEAFSAPGSLKERIQSLFRSAVYRFRSAAHTHLYRKYSLLSAAAYPVRDDGADIHLEALILYYDAFEAYPRRALDYLRPAREFEEPLIPAAAPSYDFEEGRLLGNRKLLEETLAEFDPLWERDMIAGVYEELALAGKKDERKENAERLFALNRGALLRNGIRLPVDLRIDAPGRGERTLKKAARAAGIEAVPSGKPGGTFPRYVLRLSLDGEETVSSELYDGGRGIVLFTQKLPFSPEAPHGFSRALRDGIFNAF